MPQDQCTDEVSGFCVYLMYPRFGPKEVGAQEMLMIADGTTKVTEMLTLRPALTSQETGTRQSSKAGCLWMTAVL